MNGQILNSGWQQPEAEAVDSAQGKQKEEETKKGQREVTLNTPAHA